MTRARIKVNERLVDKTISRSSIINFLNAMVDEGVLDYDERTGKGRYHRVYRPKLDEPRGRVRENVRELVSPLLEHQHLTLS